jgi:hypothetical protein
MSILEGLTLNWVQCQIRVLLVRSYNTKFMVWMLIKLLAGIQEADKIQRLDVHTLALRIRQSPPPPLPTMLGGRPCLGLICTASCMIGAFLCPPLD